MEHCRIGRRRQSVFVIILSMALLLAPLSVLAAPASHSLLETTVYEDVDGLYSIAVPNDFSAQQLVTFDVLADNELDQLLDSTGIIFAQPDRENGLSVLLLLLDETITNEDEFRGFLDAFQTAAGGETLPQVNFDLVGGDSLHASGVAATRDRHLQVDVYAWENTAAIISASLERTAYSDYRDDLRESLDSFTWDPELVAASLGSGETTPSGNTADSAVEGADRGTQATVDDLTVERYQDENGVFTISVPAELVADDLSNEAEAIYGTSFSKESVVQPTIAVAFTPALYAGNDATGDITFGAIEDDDFNAFIDAFIVNDLPELNAVTDERDALNRTAFLVLRADQADPNGPDEVWVWLEEYDGVGAVFAVFGEANDPVNAEIFHEAITTFAWWPKEAATQIADVTGVPDPQDDPVALDDPFGLLEVSYMPVFPFEGARFDENGISYMFSGQSPFGMSTVTLIQIESGQITDEEWDSIVADHEATVPSFMDDDPANPTGSVFSVEQDLPFLDADRSVFIQGDSNDYWIGSVLMEKDGVVAIYITVVSQFYFDTFQDEVLAVIEQGLDFDPDAVREALAANTELGATVNEAVAMADLPSEGEELSGVFYVDRLDGFNLAIDFKEPDLDGSLKAIVRSLNMPDYPVAQYALWLGEEQQYASGKMTTQNENGTRAAFNYTPDFPLNIGAYVADIYYNNTLVAAIAFEVSESPPEESYVENFAPAYNNDVGEPMVITTAIHPADVLTMRGSANLPVDSQVRLLWYDPDGWLLTDEVQTIRLDNSFYAPYDWIYFEPDVDWVSGYYRWVLTIDGEPLTTGNLFVVEESDIVELTDAGENIYAILPIPQELVMDVDVEGIDYVIQTTDDIPGIDLVSAIDAVLRWQGWQPALPPLGSPVEIDYRRWTKDGYQFVVEQGAEGFENELWLRYTTQDNVEYGALPSGEALTTDNIDFADTVARLEIQDRWAEDAVVSPDGNWLALTTSDGALYLFDAMRLLDTIWYQSNVYYGNPVFSPDSRSVAVTADLQMHSEVQVFSNFDIMWLPTTRLNGHTDMITDLVYQPDGWLASGGLDGSVRYWYASDYDWPYMVETGESISGLAAAPDDASGLFVAYDGGYVDYVPDSAEQDGWSDLGTVTLSPRLAAWSGLNANGVGDLIAYGEDQAEWYTYTTDEVSLAGDVPVDNPDFQSTGAAFSDNGELLVIGGPYVTFADRATGEGLGDWNITIDGEAVPVISVGFSPDSQYVIVVDDNGYLRLLAVPAQ